MSAKSPKKEIENVVKHFNRSHLIFSGFVMKVVVKNTFLAQIIKNNNAKTPEKD